MKTAIALGTFDGIHIAHRLVLELPDGYKKTAVIFRKPPKMFFNLETELLMTFETKLEKLKKMGFSDITVLDFQKVKNVSANDFLEFLYTKFNPQMISCGFNYRFGNNGAGDTELLQKFCDRKGIVLKICQPVKKDGVMVSSTQIRNLLKCGYIEKANEMLKEPFSFTAEVIKGEQRGRTIGFPTANQKYPEDLVKPKFGVYKTKAYIDGNIYDGITDIGIRPTFESDYVISETHLKNFQGNLYGKTVTIMFEKFLREEKKFDSLEELKKQIKKDISQIK